MKNDGVPFLTFSHGGEVGGCDVAGTWSRYCWAAVAPAALVE